MKVSVIIPTLASGARSAMLLRAIDSLRQQSIGVVPIVVVNGGRFDAGLVEHLKGLPDIRFFYREQGNQAAALLFGRRAVDTPFFATLDDDDEYLPDAVATRLAPLIRDPSLDAVVTNGYARHGDIETIDYPDFIELSRAPMINLMRTNWLQPVSAMYRSATITAEYFEGMPSYLEWTYLALRLAMTRKIAFIDTPTYRMHRGTPESVSASEQYLLGQPAALHALLQLQPPAAVRRALRRKLLASLHVVSEMALRRGDRPRAWRYHLLSLAGTAGYRYLPYTRHLLGRAPAAG